MLRRFRQEEESVGVSEVRSANHGEPVILEGIQGVIGGIGPQFRPNHLHGEPFGVIRHHQNLRTPVDDLSGVVGPVGIVGYVGENGIKPEVFYSCDKAGNLREVN